jgi:hypothetical protein
MMSALRLFAALWAVSGIVQAAVSTAVFQYEVLGVSDDWIVVRENIAASAADTAACRYPNLDPSEHTGARVHFVRLSAEAKRGRLAPLTKPDRSVTIYAPGRSGQACTSAGEAEQRWREITAHAKELGVSLSEKRPVPVVLGTAVPAKSCVLIGSVSGAGPPCRRVFRQIVKGATIRIAVSLTAIPEAPDERSCQFVGHRFGVAIQVAGLDFGAMGAAAPGGFADHYDCRGQQFNPLRLYSFDRVTVLVGGFRGTNIADREEHPFLVIIAARPAL